MRISVDETPELVGRVRILIDGVDVTNECVMADSDAGNAEILCRDEEHRDWRRRNTAFHVTPDGGELGPHRLIVRGDVQILRL